MGGHGPHPKLRIRCTSIRAISIIAVSVQRAPTSSVPLHLNSQTFSRSILSEFHGNMDLS
jgi:hypothetical protein